MKGCVQMRPTGKRYTEDFKKMIIEVYNSGKPVLDICSEYGVTAATLYKWIKNPPSNESKKVIVKLEATNKELQGNKEMLKLQAELDRIKEENEILKKAIAMFAKE